MRHRIFIAVNLPDDIRKKLADRQSQWPDLPIRWTKRDNLHITLSFLGYVADENLMEIFGIVKKIAAKRSAFDVKLNKIIYGPPKKMPPRMVWVEGENSQELANLQKDLDNTFSGRSITLEKETRPYAPHITLGRIKTWEFRAIEPEERPEVNEEINMDFGVSSIEVMESQLKRGGPTYAVLESCSLKD